MSLPSDQELPRLFGAYELFDLLGRGGNGSAFLAAHQSSGALVVVKCLHAKLGENEQFLRRFRHEARLAVEVDSPRIAGCYDCGTCDGVPYIVLEYVEGLPLVRFLATQKKRGEVPSLDVVIRLSIDLLDGLRDLHAAVDMRTGEPLGIAHRDIKPRNLMVEPSGRLRIIDLGLGKSSLQDWQTRTGAIMGSPGYMAPEQALARPTDARTDVYSAGSVIFEMLTMRPLIPRAPTAEMVRSCAAGAFRPPSRERAGLPPEVDDVLRAALEKDPEDRLESAAAFADALLSATRRDRTWLDGDIEITVVSSPVRTRLLETREAREVRAQVGGPAPTAEGGHANTVVFASRPIAVPTAPPSSQVMPRRTFGWAVTAILVAVVLVSALVTSIFLDTAPVESPTVTKIDERGEAPVVVPRARSMEVPPPKPLEAPPGMRRRNTTKRVAVAPEAPAEPPAEPAASRAVSVRGLSELAMRIRERRPERQQAIDGILGDISLWAKTEQSPRAQLALQELEVALHALDRPSDGAAP